VILSPTYKIIITKYTFKKSITKKTIILDACEKHVSEKKKDKLWHR